MNCPVGDAILEVKGGRARDVSRCEGRASAAAGWDLAQGGVNKADKCASKFSGNVFRTKEPGVVAAMPNEELMLDAGARVGEGTALWLEDGANAFVQGDNIEPHKEVVVSQSNDVLCGVKRLLEAGIEGC